MLGSLGNYSFPRALCRPLDRFIFLSSAPYKDTSSHSPFVQGDLPVLKSAKVLDSSQRIPALPSSPSVSFSLTILIMVRAAVYLCTIAAAVSWSQAKEIQPNEAAAAELYDSGVVHNRLMDLKTVCWT